MKNIKKLKQIIEILKTSAEELELLDKQIKKARLEVKEILKNQKLKLPIETKKNKKGAYLTITYSEQKPNLPEEINGIPIREIKKKDG